MPKTERPGDPSWDCQSTSTRRRDTRRRRRSLKNCAVDFVEICTVCTRKAIIKADKRISNSDKICRSYCDFYFGVTFLEHSVYWKRCKIGGKLVLFINRKLHMCFQLVPKSVTLNDLERRNGHYFVLFRRIR